MLVGVARYPKGVKRSINKKKFIKKTSVKPFIKYVNQNHVMPTRFLVNDFDLKEIKEDSLKTAEAKKALTKELKKKLTEGYRTLPDPKTNEKAGNIRFFYNKLRF